MRWITILRNSILRLKLDHLQLSLPVLMVRDRLDYTNYSEAWCMRDAQTSTDVDGFSIALYYNMLCIYTLETTCTAGMVLSHLWRERLPTV